jgi:signal peptidase II
MYYFIILAVVAFDQFTKLLVRINLQPFNGMDNSGAPVIEGLLDINFVKNTGAAFNIMQGQADFLIIFNLLVISILFVFLTARRKVETRFLLAGIALIIGGGVGNFVDRVRFGYVVDFIDFHFFPVFNVADISVCLGCAATVAAIVASEWRKGKSANGPAK